MTNNNFKLLRFTKRTRPEVFLRLEEIDGQEVYVLHNLILRQTFFLQETNREIWNMLDGSKSVGEIIELMYKEYPNITKQTIEADVETFLKILSENGFVFSI